MNTDKRRWFNDQSERVLEKVYQRALAHELRLRRIHAAAEVSFSVTYKRSVVGGYFAGIVVEDLCLSGWNAPGVSPTNAPPSALTICEPRAALCVCLSISKSPGSSGGESSTDFSLTNRSQNRLCLGDPIRPCLAIF
jgi:hypothetical protein